MRITTLVAVLALGSAALAGCAAADPDLSGLESELSAVDGVNDATAGVTHSGAPWNTQLVVTLYVEDPTDDGIVDAVRAVAPVFVADEAARHEVSLYFIPGQRSDYESDFDAESYELTVTPEVAEALGVPDSGPYSLRLSPAQMREIANGE